MDNKICPSITVDNSGNILVAFFSDDIICGTTCCNNQSFPPNVIGTTGFTAGNEPNPNVNVNNVGQEYINPVTGDRFISNGVMWVLAPCCATPGSSGVTGP